MPTHKYTLLSRTLPITNVIPDADLPTRILTDLFKLSALSNTDRRIVSCQLADTPIAEKVRTINRILLKHRITRLNGLTQRELSELNPLGISIPCTNDLLRSVPYVEDYLSVYGEIKLERVLFKRIDPSNWVNTVTGDKIDHQAFLLKVSAHYKAIKSTSKTQININRIYRYLMDNMEIHEGYVTTSYRELNFMRKAKSFVWSDIDDIQRSTDQLVKYITNMIKDGKVKEIK